MPRVARAGIRVQTHVDTVATRDDEFDSIVISEEQFNRAVHYLKGLKRGLVEFLKNPRRVSIVNFPVEMDDDTTTEKMRAKLYAALDSVFNRWQAFVVGEESTQNHMPDFRTIALAIAIERVVHATLLRGIWP